MLSAEMYLGGAAASIAVLAAIAWGAASARRWWLPAWEGPAARLAEVVLVVAAVVGSGRVAGAMTMLRPLPTACIALVAAVVLGAVGRLGRRRRQPAPGRGGGPNPTGRGRWSRREAIAAGSAVGLVSVQWLAHVGDAYSRGMVHVDTLWYHQPFAARFLQVGGFQGIDGLGAPETQWYPFDSQLVHALAMLPFERDILSPLVNVAWAAVALLAAWVLGARSGAGPLAVVAATAVLGLPAVMATQPGQASNDIACAALLLAAAALLVEGRLAPAPTVLAGIAAGLALSTKVTVAAPGALLIVGVIVIALRARRGSAALGWILAVLAAGSFWFVRNWVGAGSPLPWFDLDLGPVRLPAVVTGARPSLRETIGDSDAWRDLYLPGLWQGLGRAWPLIIAVAVAGGVLALRRSQSPAERLLGAAVVVGFGAHIVTPLSGGYSFVFNLRFLVPVVLLGFVLFARAAGEAGGRSRAAATVVLVALVAIGATSPNRERIAAWPADEVVPALAVAANLAAAVAAVLILRPARPSARWRGRPALLLASVGVAALVIAGWPVQRTYLGNRYVEAGLFLDDVNRYFVDVHDARVAIFGMDETLPIFGLDLSNEVRRGLDRGRIGSDHCWAWRSMLRDRFDYIVLTRYGFGHYIAPSPWVIADDDAATEVVAAGVSRVYRLSGPLDPHTCPTGWDWLPLRHRTV